MMGYRFRCGFVVALCLMVSGCGVLPAWVPGSTAMVEDKNNTDVDVLEAFGGSLNQCAPHYGQQYHNDSQVVLLPKRSLKLGQVDLVGAENIVLEAAHIRPFTVGAGNAMPGLGRGWPGDFAKGQNLDILPLAAGFALEPPAGKDVKDLSLRTTKGRLDTYNLVLKLKIVNMKAPAVVKGYRIAFNDASGRSYVKNMPANSTTQPVTCETPTT